jgi:hypothetical protein
MTFNTSQNYTNMVICKHGIQTFEVVLVMLLLWLLSFDLLSPQVHPFLIIGQVVYLTILKCQLPPLNMFPKVLTHTCIISSWSTTLIQLDSLGFIFFIFIRLHSASWICLDIPQISLKPDLPFGSLDIQTHRSDTKLHKLMCVFLINMNINNIAILGLPMCSSHVLMSYPNTHKGYIAPKNGVHISDSAYKTNPP